ncbi:MAG: hypothetical protein ACQCXQ_02425 [Verrucomicrobiales bacterium]|nr:hypothetical protein [Verrucomicrobiota bacterium JB025]
MRTLALFLALFALNSCNTLTGIGRDINHSYHWTKNKIDEHNSGYSDSSYDTGYSSGAPIY